MLRVTRIFFFLAALYGSLGVCIECYGQVAVIRSSNIVQEGRGVYYRHKVTKGQTLYSIAKAYGVSEDEILKANALQKGYTIKVREVLNIPFRGVGAGSQAGNDIAEKNVNGVEKYDTAAPNAIELASTIAPFSSGKDGVQAGTIKVANDDAVEIETIEMIDTASGNTGSGWLQAGTGGRSDVAINVVGASVDGLFLLPTSNGVISDPNAQDLYKGAKLAVNDLQSDGVDANISFREEMVGKASYVVAMGDLYSRGGDIARMQRIPLIAPLTGIAGGAGFEMQFAPENGGKYAKFREIFNRPESNVLVIEHNTYCDTSALFEMNAVVPFEAAKMTYSRTMKASDLAFHLSKEKINYVVVPVNHQGSIEDILSKLTSLNSLKKEYDIRVLGTNKWKNLPNINPDLLFRASVSYPTSYHADRGNDRIVKFYNDYIAAYGELPNAFSMRGYDIVIIMSEAISEWGSNALINISNSEFLPLQTPYRFSNGGTKIYNDSWVVVTMTPDYKITTN